jgi:glutathione S-transferase
VIRQATADGILDAAVARRLQMGQPQDDGRKAFDARQKAAVERALAVLRERPAARAWRYRRHQHCLRAWLPSISRFAAEPWRDACPKLAAWFAEVSKLAPLAETVPVG